MRKKPLKGSRKKGIPKELKLLTACPLCHAPYKPAQARVLDETGGRHLLHIQCAKCGNSVLALLLSGSEGMGSVGVVTDLSSEDALRFKEAGAVTADDVIGLHQLFEQEKNFIEKLKH